MFCFAAADTVRPAQAPDDVKVTMFGDSYGYGVNNDSIKTRYGDILGDRLGAHALISAVGGSGYLNAVNGFTWRQRVANGDLAESLIGKQDLVFVFGSVNGSGYSDAAVQAEVALTVRAMMSAQPGAIIMVAGPQFTANKPTLPSRYAAVKSGVVAAAGADPLVVSIDNSPAGEAWQTGGEKAGATTGLGNNDIYLGPDGSHWAAAGNYYGGRRIADSVVNKLRALPSYLVQSTGFRPSVGTKVTLRLRYEEQDLRSNAPISGYSEYQSKDGPMRSS